MEEMANFTVDNWIAIAAILIPIFLGWLYNVHTWLWSAFRKYVLNKKIEVVTPALDKRFSSLNKCLFKINRAISSIATEQPVYLITEVLKREVRTQRQPCILHPVSYTHLTLPTNREV